MDPAGRRCFSAGDTVTASGLNRILSDLRSGKQLCPAPTPRPRGPLSMPEIDLLLQTCVNAIYAASFMALIAVGLVLIFGVMGVINFAHGELYMLGAYAVVFFYAGSGACPTFLPWPCRFGLRRAAWGSPWNAPCSGPCGTTLWAA